MSNYYDPNEFDDDFYNDPELVDKLDRLIDYHNNDPNYKTNPNDPRANDYIYFRDVNNVGYKVYHDHHRDHYVIFCLATVDYTSARDRIPSINHIIRTLYPKIA